MRRKRGKSGQEVGLQGDGGRWEAASVGRVVTSLLLLLLMLRMRAVARLFLLLLLVT